MDIDGKQVCWYYLAIMSQNNRHRKQNPHKPQRNFKNLAIFLAVALTLIFFIEFVVFKGEPSYITKIKQDYYTEQAAKQTQEQKAIEEALPPIIVFPEDGSEYFEAPIVEPTGDQSLLPEKQLNLTKLAPEKETISPDAEKLEKKPAINLNGQKPRIAIVIDDVGMNINESHKAINLPAPITLAMLPYAQKVRELATEGKANGHQLIIHTPMEAMSDKVDLGSLALRSNMPSQDFKNEFDKIAASFDGYEGINNHMGSRLTQDSAAMKMLMVELKKRGLFFLDSRTINTSIAAQAAEQAGVPNASRDVFLDHEETPQFVSDALKKVERVARDHGSAIAIGHPKEVTMVALEKWIPTLEGKGFELVKLSSMMDKPNGSIIVEAKVKPASQQQ